MPEQEERFIDADEHEFGNDTQTYESIIISQIRECVKVLSKDPIRKTEQMSVKGKPFEKSVELFDEEFNHVDTLKMLLSPWFDTKNFDTINGYYKSIQDYKDKIGESKINVIGKGIRKLSEIETLPQGHILIRKISIYRARIARQIFEELVKLYHNKKMEIARFSVEEDE